MSRPKGSRNKSKEYPVKTFEESVNNVSVAQLPVISGEVPVNISPVERRATIRYDGIFGVRFLRKDSLFPGLWELVKLDENMKRIKVITDANAKGQVQVLLMREVKRLVAVA